MATYSTDFSEYATDVQPSDWTKRWTTTDWEWIVREEEGAMGGKFLECVQGPSPPPFDMAAGISWNGPSTDPGRVTAEVVMRIRASAGTELFGFARGFQSFGARYLAFGLEYHNHVARIRRQTGGHPANLGFYDVFARHNIWFWVRGRVQGSSLYIKVWRDGDPEPYNWQVTGSDTFITASGWIGLNRRSTGRVDCDYFAVGTGGDSAPIPRKGKSFIAATSSISGKGEAPQHIIAAPELKYDSETGSTITVEIPFYDPKALRHDLYRSTSPMQNKPLRNGTKIGSNIDPGENFIDNTVIPDNTYYYQLVSSRLAPIGEPEFTFVIQTDAIGSSANNQFELTGAQGSYNLEGQSLEGPETVNLNGLSGAETITFPRTGLWRLWLTPLPSGGFHRIQFNNGGDAKKILAIEHWGTSVHWSSMERAFYGCDNIIIMPTGPIHNASGISSFAYCFNSVGWSDWDFRLLHGASLATSFEACFANNGIEIIPNDFFRDCSSVQSFEACFANNSITQIPPGLFSGKTQALNFNSCFLGNNLSTIPSNLFDDCTQVIDFGYCFAGNGDIMPCPPELFQFNTVADFPSVFEGSTLDMFDYSDMLVNLGAYHINNLSRSFHAGESTPYTGDEAVEARDTLTGPREWTIIDGEEIEGNFVFTIDSSTQTSPLQFIIPAEGEYDLHAEFLAGGYDDIVLEDLLGSYTLSLPIEGEWKITLRPTGTDPLYRIRFHGNLANARKVIAINSWGTKVYWKNLMYMCRDTRIKSLPSGPIYNLKGVYSVRYMLASISDPATPELNLSQIPSDLFKFADEVEDFAGVFLNTMRYITDIPGDLLKNCHSAILFSDTFRQSTSTFVAGVITSIPPGLFKDLTNVTHLDNCFANHGSLSTIEEGAFEGLSNLVSAEGIFRYNTSLTSLPSPLFPDSTALKNLSWAFAHSAVSTITPGVFQNLSSLETLASAFSNSSLSFAAQGTFEGLSQLTSIGSIFQGSSLSVVSDNLFKDCIGLTSVANFMANTSSLTEVQGAPFRGCVNITSFNSAYSNCANLTTLSPNMFDGPTAATDFANVFNTCTSLSVLPPGLFDSSPAMETLWRGFYRQSFGEALTSIPTGFLANKPNLNNLTQLCYGQRGLTSIPEDFYTAQTNPVTNGNVFYFGGVASISSNIFQHPGIVNIGAEFYDCFIEEIPEGIFDNLTNLETINSTFQRNQVHTIPANLFAGCTSLKNIRWLFADQRYWDGSQSIFTLTQLPAGFFSSFANGAGIDGQEVDLRYVFRTNRGVTSVPSGYVDNITGTLGPILVEHIFSLFGNDSNNMFKVSFPPDLINHWNNPNIIWGAGPINGCNIDTGDYSDLLINLANNFTRTGLNLSNSPSNYSGSAAQDARDYLVNDLGWTINDAGPA